MRKAGAKTINLIQNNCLKFVIINLFLLKFLPMIKNQCRTRYKINDWGKNVYVKVPVVNSKNKFTGKVIRKLNSKNIKLNITAVYTAKQTKKILKLLNKKTK